MVFLVRLSAEDKLDILAITITIGLSIAANLLTPKVSDWIGRRYAKVRSRSIKQLNDELAYITKLHNSPEKVTPTLLGYVLVLVIFLSLAALCGFIVILYMVTSPDKSINLPIAVISGAGIAVLGVMLRIALRAFDIISELASFEEYIKKAQDRIQELEHRNKVS